MHTWTFPPPDAAGTALYLLGDRWSPCGSSCRFCPTSLVARPEPLTHAPTRARILADLEAQLAAHPPKRVALASADILTYPDLFELLDRVRAAGAAITLVSPGWGLADAAFAQRLKSYDATVDLTWLSDDAATYAQITGVVDARERVIAGIEGALAAGLTLRLSTVLTTLNAHELPQIARSARARFGVDRLLVRWFFPDMDEAPVTYLDQWPSYAGLRPALDALDAGTEAIPTLEVRNVPLCQVDLRGLRRVSVELPPYTEEQNRFNVQGTSPCRTCEAAPRCVRLHPSYTERHTPAAVDADVIAAAYALGARRFGILPGQGRAKGEGRLPGEGVARGEGLLPGQGIPKGQGTLP